MNVFDQYLTANNIDVLTDNSPYSHPTFINENKLFSALDDIIENNKRVMIFSDCDPDGLLSGTQFRDMFRRFNFSNYTMWNYANKKHEIDQSCVYACLENRYDYLIVVDVGINEMNTISKLATFGVTPIIIDHHIGNYSYDEYPENSVIINSSLNNRFDANNFYRLSAGALVFCLLYKYGSLRRKNLASLSVHALITLYSDSVDMEPALNRSIYRLATNLSLSTMPYFVRDFIGNSVFRRRFIEFTLVPKINSLFRSEQFDLINKYFFEEDIDTKERSYYLERIKELHENSRALVDRVTDLVKREELNNFVLANLNTSGIPVSQYKLYNYTGLIANNLASEYGKPCIVLCDAGNQIKGSFRDNLGRDYLQIFSQVCKCGGHPAAFGIHIDYFDLSSFIDMMKYTIDTNFTIERIRDNLIIPMSTPKPDKNLLDRIAMYNEFSGITLPIALVSKRHVMKERSNFKSNNYEYSWGDLIVESRYKLVLDSYVKIKPVLSKSTRLITYNRG